MGSPEDAYDRQTKKFWWSGTAALPLTYEELLKRADCWTLGADAATATLLQQTSSKLILGTHEVVARLQEACRACDRVGVRVTNLTGSFLLLSNAQFVENRTYGEGAPDERSQGQDDTAPPPSDQLGATPLEEAGAALFSCQQAIRNGLDLADRVHERVQISDSESDSERGILDGSHDNSPLMVLRHVDPYASRGLPHVIGSRLFLEDVWLGFGPPATPLQEESPSSPPQDSSEDNSSPVPEVPQQEVTSPSDRPPVHVPPNLAKEAGVPNEPARPFLFESSSNSDAEGIFTGPVADTASSKRVPKGRSIPRSTSSTETRVLEEPHLQEGTAEGGGAQSLQDVDSSDDGDDLFVPIRKPPLRARVGGPAPCLSGLPPFIGAPPSRRGIFDSSSDDERAIFAPLVTEEPSHAEFTRPKSPMPPHERAPHRPPLETTQSDDVISSAGPLSPPTSVEKFIHGSSVPSIFSDDEGVDDIFAGLPPKKAGGKPIRREVLSNEDDIFAGPIGLPKTSNSTSNSTAGNFSAPSPEGHPSIFSDDEDDDNDLFSIGPPKSRKFSLPVVQTGISESGDTLKEVPKSGTLLESLSRRPAGGVALFGGPELLSKLRERRSEEGSTGSSLAASTEEAPFKPSSGGAMGTPSVEPPPLEPASTLTPTKPNGLLDPAPPSSTLVSIGVETGIAFDRESRSTPLLFSVTKSRPRLQQQRKPPSKKSRGGAGLIHPPQKDSSTEDAPPSLFCSPAKEPPAPPDISSEVQKKAKLCNSVEKQKKAPLSRVSIFADDDADGDEDLFSSMSSRAGLAPKQISLFSDDDEPMFTGPVSPPTQGATTSKEEGSLFDEDDDLFSSQTLHPKTMKPPTHIETGGSSGSASRHLQGPSSGSHLISIEGSDDPLSKFLS